jgi:hypothetical protein
MLKLSKLNSVIIPFKLISIRFTFLKTEYNNRALREALGLKFSKISINKIIIRVPLYIY